MQIVGIEMKAEAKSVVRLQRHGMPAFCSTYIARLLFITKISKLHMIKKMHTKIDFLSFGPNVQSMICALRHRMDPCDAYPTIFYWK